MGLAPLELSQKLLELSRNMADAAARLDSDALLSLEAERQALIQQLPERLEALPDTIRRQLAADLCAIQAFDSAVRARIDPWFEQIATYLGQLSANRE